MTTKNCANGPKLMLKDLCEKSFVRNVLYSNRDHFFEIAHCSSNSYPSRLGSVEYMCQPRQEVKL